MSVPTVKAHVSHILTKLGLGNRTQIAMLVHEADLDA
jgi:DNA-binding NarL/FixJ family response regulator